MNEGRRVPLSLDDLPWYLSPYFIASILGITVLTLLRPCTRYVPEPMPILGDAPPWMAGALPQDEGVSVTTYYEAGCAPCVQAIEGLARVSRELSWTEGNAEFVILHPASSDLSAVSALYAYEPRWRGEVVDVPADWRTDGLASPMILDMPEAWDQYREGGWIWILDGSRAVRGPLQASDERGIDEVLHRTQHVLRVVSEGSEQAP